MTVNIDGMRIYYRDEGSHHEDRPALVLLHGWGSNTELFDGIYRLASPKYRVIGPDFPGAGQSEEPAEPMDLDDYVSFVEKFLAAAAPEEQEMIFLGHSHGGRVMIRLAARRARAAEAREPGGNSTDLASTEPVNTISGSFRITSMILVDSAGIVPAKTGEQSRKTARYKRYKAILTKSGLTRLFPGALDALQKKFGSADYAAASPVMRQTMVRVVNTDLTDEMPSVKMPVLLIWGDADTATPIADGKRMEELMPEAGLAVIPGAGHFSFLDNPVLFGRILASFLKIG
ncbi:MAG: alpha/beta hydrolase [Lachnospiraceae bacterium]|nr:alpha/beta hydrolase [Lachnospiraceae bacterium]